MSNLFTSQTPSGTNNSDGSPGISLGTTVRFAADGTVTGIRFYATTTVSGTYTVALYQVTNDDTPGPGTGNLLASKVAGTAPTAGTWNTVDFDTPVPVTTVTLYRAVVHSSAGRYVNTSSFFTSDLVNGDITADANGDDPVGLGSLAQGTFEVNAALTYPNDTFSSSCYFVDVEFTVDTGTSPVSSSLELQWQVKNVVASGIDLRWAVATVVSSPLDLRWSVRSVVMADLEFSWLVRNVVSAPVDLPWALLATISAPVDLPWAQRSLVGSPLDLRWGIGTEVSGPIDLRWLIRIGAASSLSLLWLSEAAPLPTERTPTEIRAILTQHISTAATPLTIVYRR